MLPDKNLNRLVILCGGTGGHFFPGLTIARNLQQQQNKEAYLFIGGHKNKLIAQKIIAEKYGIKVYVINSARFSKTPVKLLKFIFFLVMGFFKGRKLLKSIVPEAVLGMGSFTSVPVSFAAISLKIPLFLHDGNARIGRANIFLSKWACLTMSAFPAVNEHLLKSSYSYTGMPLRPEILAAKLEKQQAIAQLNKIYGVNFTSEKQTILIFGGSQGAATINRVLPETIKKIANSNIQIIHIFGIKKEINPYSEFQKASLVLQDSDQMHILYSIADLVISRSGGSTVAELVYFKKPAILIPYPLASDLHQNDNAEFYLQSGLAEIILNKDCNTESMQQLIIKKLGKSNNQPSGNLSLPNATDTIINAIKMDSSKNS